MLHLLYQDMYSERDGCLIRSFALYAAITYLILPLICVIDRFAIC